MIDYEEIAKQWHGDQQYGEYPYTTHLRQVAQVLRDCGYVQRGWAAVAWLHDVLEDTDYGYTRLRNDFGDYIAQLVFKVSGFGANRKLKQANILHKIAGDREACILKAADRIANLEFAARTKSRYRQGYLKERAEFDKVVVPHLNQCMAERLAEAYMECEDAEHR